VLVYKSVLVAFLRPLRDVEGGSYVFKVEKVVFVTVASIYVLVSRDHPE